MSILSICLSPGVQRTVVAGALALGEVNRLRSVLLDVGGKGVDVCRVLQRLGKDAQCLAQGGENADEILALAAQEGLNLRLVPSSGRLRTCTTIVEMNTDGGRRVTELVEPSAPVDAACVEKMTQAIRQALPHSSALVIAGSMAPGFPPAYQAQLASWARHQGVPVFVDVQGAALREVIDERPALVKINLAEFAATFLGDGFCGGEQSGALAEPVLEDGLQEALRKVSRACPVSFVLTRGPNSVLLLSAGELRTWPVTPLPADEILSPIGSGDAFLAALLAGWLDVAEGSKAAPGLDRVERVVEFAIACAQSNARTLRPGYLEDGFCVEADRIRGYTHPPCKD